MTPIEKSLKWPPWLQYEWTASYRLSNTQDRRSEKRKGASDGGGDKDSRALELVLYASGSCFRYMFGSNPVRRSAFALWQAVLIPPPLSATLRLVEITEITVLWRPWRARRACHDYLWKYLAFTLYQYAALHSRWPRASKHATVGNICTP
jgi:hypothetical protein